MKLASINIPEMETVTIKLNGEYIHIPREYEEVVYDCKADEITVTVFADHDPWRLATFEIEESDDVDVLELLSRGYYRRYLYDGYDVDAAIEWILEQCKA